MIRAQSNHITRTLKKVQTIVKRQAFLLPLFVVILAIPLAHGASSEEKRVVVPVKKEVLGASITPTQIFVSPTVTPTRTVRQTVTQPTKTPTLTPSVTAAPVQSIIYVQTPVTSAPTVAPSPTVTVSPIPIVEKVEIKIDYAGQKLADSYSIPVQPNQTAWDVLVQAIGTGNIQYTDYGEMGYFVTGLNGINAAPNQFYEFKVNGVSSMVGVSFYQCKSGDVLEFVLTSF